MNLGLARLVLLGSPGAWRRLAGIAAGVAIGVALFLTLWGASSALELRDARTGWTNPASATSVGDRQPEPLTDTTALFARDYDVFRGASLHRIGVAATPDTSLALPGGITLPAAGEYLASPALADLIARVPADQLGDRFGEQVGILPENLLEGPDSLVIVEGYREADMPGLRGTAVITGFDGTPKITKDGYRTVITIGSIAVFLPVLLLIGIVTQLGAAQRAERFATLRLIGASPAVITRMAACEIGVASLIGSIAGIGLAWAVRPVAALVTIEGTRFFPADLATTPLVALLAVIVVPAAAALVALRRVRRAGIGPLGATRQRAERTPRARRLLPLLVGLAAMGAAAGFAKLLPNPVVSALLILGFTALSAGIITGGPWVVRQLSTWFAPRAGTAAGVIAAARIRRTPAATFRSVSGLVLAVFMATVFAGAATVATPLTTPREAPGLLPADAAYVLLKPGANVEESVDPLSAVQGVTSVVLAYRDEADVAERSDTVTMKATDAVALGFENVPANDLVAFRAGVFVDPRSESAPKLEPVNSRGRLVPALVFIRTDGAEDSLERAQTAAIAHGVTALAPPTRATLADLGTRGVVNSLATLAYLGVTIAILTAGVSLTVSTAASILDRRRVFGLLRLMGMPTSVLNRIIGIEAATPLLGTIAFTIALGFLVAWLMITGITNKLSMTWPDHRYVLTLAFSAGLALIAVGAVFRAVRKDTALSATRFE
nr:ABC transporter permease [Propionicimonas sp.]